MSLCTLEKKRAKRNFKIPVAAQSCKPLSPTEVSQSVAHYQTDVQSERKAGEKKNFVHFLTAQCGYDALIKIKPFFCFNEYVDRESE